MLLPRPLLKHSSNKRVLSASGSLIILAFITTLITTALNICATVYNIRILRQLRPPKMKEYSYIDDDYPDQLPLSLPEVTLRLDSGAPHFSLLADDEWGTTFPSPGNGFVMFGPSNRSFVLSLYHQLHCLDAIRVSFVVNGSTAAHHVEHCLRYLRQTILCSADTTLEAAEKDETGQDTANGVGMMHRCKDWTKLKEWMSENSRYQ